jgi:hypothetical protein
MNTPNCNATFDVTPDCNIELHIAKTSTANAQLRLKQNVVTFEQFPHNADEIVLSLPYTYVKGCHMFYIDPTKLVFDEDNINRNVSVLNNNDMADKIVVKLKDSDVNLDAASPNKGYVDLILTTESGLPFGTNEDCTLSLIFDIFCIPLKCNYLYSNCALKCNTLMWNYNCNPDAGVCHETTVSGSPG